MHVGREMEPDGQLQPFRRLTFVCYPRPARSRSDCCRSSRSPRQSTEMQELPSWPLQPLAACPPAELAWPIRQGAGAICKASDTAFAARQALQQPTQAA